MRIGGAAGCPWRGMLVLFFSISSAVPAMGDPAEIPGDPQKFTEFVAQSFRAVLPGHSVSIAGPLVLEIDGRGGHRLDLGNPFRLCHTDPLHCEASVSTYMIQMAGVITTPPKPIARADLRAIVRSTDEAKAGGDSVAAPLLGGLSVICAVDEPETIALLRTEDLAPLKLSSDTALAACKENMGENLGQLEPTQRDYPLRGINVITGNAYASSWLLFPERWAAEAKRLRGNLLVAVPAADVVLYRGGKSTTAIKGLAEAAAFVQTQATRLVSTTVFRWTPDGWVVAESR
jgi:hypothetical protein